MAVLNWKQTYDLNSTTTFVSTDIFYLARSPYGVANDFGFLYSSLIPITTKGDLFTFSSVNARLGVGTDGTILQANSATSTGLNWTVTSYPGSSLRGDMIYASANNVYAPLTGNTTTTKQYLSGTGDGMNPGAPTWSTIDGADIVGHALTETNDTNVTLTLGGSASTSLLRAASITAGWTGQLGLTRGGTAASLTASNGGIVYSTASAFAVLGGTATSHQVLLSGSTAAPTWSTATYPVTTVINQLLYSSSANTIVGLATTPQGALVTDASGVPSIVAPGVNGDGFLLASTLAGAPAWTTTAYPTTSNKGDIIYASTANTFTTLAGNTTTAKLFLTQTGTGAQPNAPAWSAITGGGTTWSTVTGTSQSMAVNSGYVANNAGVVTMTLPTTAAVGDVIYVTGLGTGGWSIAQNASQLIHVGSLASTTGVGGSVSSTNQYDTIGIRCIVANTTWTVMEAQTSGFTVV
jgi:hypothetical protein